jgi:hypothetical protein
MGILYPDISITKEVYCDFKFQYGANSSYYGNYVQSRDWGRKQNGGYLNSCPIATKMAIEVVKDIDWQKRATLLNKLHGG